jgi:hypothetical protein
MSPARVIRSRRRIAALVQMLLFVFSTSTMLLPCAHPGGAVALTHAVHSAAATTVASPMEQHQHHHDVVTANATAPERQTAPPSQHAPGNSDSACPWVVGCVGMLQFTVDVSWRSVEAATPVTSPVGVTLQYVTTDRDIDSPPPRA